MTFIQSSQPNYVKLKKKQNKKPQYHPVIMGSDAMDTVSEQLKKFARPQSIEEITT